MQKKFKAVGFDWSGVVFFHSMNYRNDGSKFLNISKEEFSAAYFKYNHLSNLKNIGPKEFWTTVFAELGRESEVEGFLSFLASCPPGKMNQEILSLIEILKRKGYKTGLLSNNTSSGASEARSFGVDNIFEIALFSAEVGAMKPHKDAFDLLAGKLGVDISEMIFIDDAEKSLEKAYEIGYHPILYTDMRQLLGDLVHLKILTQDEIEHFVS